MNARELIFYAGQLSYKEIINLTESLQTKLKFRYHKGGSCSIVGSDTSTENGETLSEEIYFAIARSSNRRMKRLIDVVTVLFFLLTFPIHVFVVKKPMQFFANCLAVLVGKKTWVGYTTTQHMLPYLKKSVLAPNGKKRIRISPIT